MGDRKHVHHKLMTAGLSHYEAVTAIYAIQAGMVGLAYLLRWQSDTLIVPLYLIPGRHRSGPLYRRRAWTDSTPARSSARVRSDRWLSDVLSVFLVV